MNHTDLVEAVQQSGNVFINNFPVGGRFGIDLRSWESGEKFRGVKLIPSGLHIITYDALNAGTPSNDTATVGAPLCSFFINITEAGQTSVLTWDEATYSLQDMERSNDASVQQTASALKAGVQRLEFDANLGAYPHDQTTEWKNFLRNTTFADICRIRPAANMHIANNSLPLTAAEAEASGCPLPDSDPHGPTGRLFFAETPTMPANLRLQEITKWKMDGTGRLLKMASSLGRGNISEGLRCVLSEFELAFVLFFVAQNYSGFEQWKVLVDVIFTAEEALNDARYEEFFTKACVVAAHHVNNIPADLFAVDESFLPEVFSSFAEIVSSPSPTEEHPSLRTAIDALLCDATTLLGNLTPEDDGAVYVSTEGTD